MFTTCIQTNYDTPICRLAVITPLSVTVCMRVMYFPRTTPRGPGLQASEPCFSALGRPPLGVIARPLQTQDSTIQKHEDTHPCLERNSNLGSQHRSGQDPHLRPHGHCILLSVLVWQLSMSRNDFCSNIDEKFWNCLYRL